VAPSLVLDRLSRFLGGVQDSRYSAARFCMIGAAVRGFLV
jgi:hypothetical protein